MKLSNIDIPGHFLINGEPSPYHDYPLLYQLKHAGSFGSEI